MKIYLLTICAMIIIIFTSCMDATSGRRFEKDYIVVAGSIYSGEPIYNYPLIIGKTSDLVNNLNLLDLVILHADVTIEEVESRDSTVLRFNLPKRGYVDETKAFIISAGKTYRLTVRIGDDVVWAQTTVPNEFELIDFQDSYTYDSDRLYFPKVIHSEIDLKHPLRMLVPNRRETQIRIEYFCLEEYEDAYIVYPFSDYLGDRPENKEDYDGNEYDPGFRKNIEISSLFPNEENIMTIPFHQLQFRFYGDHKITINIIDENFYKYRYKSQGYFHGGISTGGIGYFGSATSHVVYTRVVR